MPYENTQVTCKICRQVMPWGKIRGHHITVHGMKMKPRQPKEGQITPLPDKPLDALGTFQKARAEMKEAMGKIDDERAQLMNRLRDLDDLAAKMKPLL